MRSSLVLTVIFLCAACYYAVRLYKTKEIPFLDDAVEGFTEVIGIKPEIVEKRIEKKVEKIEHEARIEKARLEENKPSIDSGATVKVKPVEEKKDVFASIATEDKKDDQPLQSQHNEQKKDDPFGNIASENEDSNESPANAVLRYGSIPCEVFKTQEIVNDGKIQLRLKEAFTGYKKGFVVEGTTALHEGRYVIHVTSLGVSCYNSKNSEGGQEVLARQKSKGKVVLSEGESVVLYYSK